MSTSKKYCQECGVPSVNLVAKFCGECGHPFGTNVRAAVPAPEPQQRVRPQRRRNDVADDDEEHIEEGVDAAYVPEINELEVDVEVYSNREQIGRLAGTSRSDFTRPPEKVPKSKKAFEGDFMKEWQQEAGTARKKK
jgi:ribosomal protein L37E